LEKIRDGSKPEHNSGGSILMSRYGSIPVSGETLFSRRKIRYVFPCQMKIKEYPFMPACFQVKMLCGKIRSFADSS